MATVKQESETPGGGGKPAFALCSPKKKEEKKVGCGLVGTERVGSLGYQKKEINNQRYSASCSVGGRAEKKKKTIAVKKEKEKATVGQGQKSQRKGDQKKGNQEDSLRRNSIRGPQSQNVAGVARKNQKRGVSGSVEMLRLAPEKAYYLCSSKKHGKFRLFYQNKKRGGGKGGNNWEKEKKTAMDEKSPSNRASPKVIRQGAGPGEEMKKIGGLHLKGGVLGPWEPPSSKGPGES